MNPEKEAWRTDSLLKEAIEKLFYNVVRFSVRFIQEKLRDSEYYDSGHALTKHATLKELFATHLVVL